MQSRAFRSRHESTHLWSAETGSPSGSTASRERCCKVAIRSGDLGPEMIRNDSEKAATPAHGPAWHDQITASAAAL